MNGRQDVRERLCAFCAAAVTLGAALAWHHGAAAWVVQGLLALAVPLWLRSDE